MGRTRWLSGPLIEGDLRNWPLQHCGNRNLAHLGLHPVVRVGRTLVYSQKAARSWVGKLGSYLSQWCIYRSLATRRENLKSSLNDRAESNWGLDPPSRLYIDRWKLSWASWAIDSSCRWGTGEFSGNPNNDAPSTSLTPQLSRGLDPTSVSMSPKFRPLSHTLFHPGFEIKHMI